MQPVSEPKPEPGAKEKVQQQLAQYFKNAFTKKKSTVTEVAKSR